jgi:hypothetical protein
MRLSLRHAFLLGVCFCAPETAARADEFLLATGAKIRGEWLNREERSAERYVIKTEFGGSVSLDRRQVSEIKRRSNVEEEYDRMAPRFTDTVDDQWKLAEWCRQHGLKWQREPHLRRIVELDPEHVKARRALGYSEIGGQWVMKEEFLKQQGYVRYKGKWRLPQEIELTKRRRALKVAKREWYAKLKRWREQLGSEKAREALENIAAVRDPLAIEALGRLLQAERDRRVRLLLVEVLGQIEGHEATAALISHALSNQDVEVFHECVDQLQPRGTPIVVGQLAQGLKSSDIVRINRAANALGRLGDQSVISPLIDALVTQHQTASGNCEGLTTTFASGPQMPGSSQPIGSTTPVTVVPGQTLAMSPGGGVGGCAGPGGSFSMTRGGRVTNRQSLNQEVLQALVSLTGVSFSFDQQAWRNWHGLQQRHQRQTSANARRGT